jgi:hypothetical protein
MIVLHCHTKSIEKDQNYDKPVEPLLFYSAPNKESEI